MAKLYSEKLNPNDPNAQAKYLSIESLRYLSSEVRNLKEGIYSKLYLTISLIFAILISIFAKSLNWLIVLLLVDLLLIILCIFAKKFMDERREHAKLIRKVIEDLNKLGVNIKE